MLQVDVTCSPRNLRLLLHTKSQLSDTGCGVHTVTLALGRWEKEGQEGHKFRVTQCGCGGTHLHNPNPWEERQRQVVLRVETSLDHVVRSCLTDLESF